MKKKISIIGNFGDAESTTSGQVIKTLTIYETLTKLYGEDDIIICDSSRYKKFPFLILFNVLMALLKTRNVIIMPAQNGVRFIPSVIIFFNHVFKRKTHYIVVGGWLPEFLTNNKRIKNSLMNFNGIYVETKSMYSALLNHKFQNVFIMPNFKNLKIVYEKSRLSSATPPFRLCTFSRVTEAKGIEDAIKSVSFINEKYAKDYYYLDIYGQIDKNFEKRFNNLILDNVCVNYKGVVDYNNSVDVLKNYFCLLFPTFYEGEGFPGTIIDAHASGIPVIATDWKYNSELVTNNLNGIIYNRNNDGLILVLEQLLIEPNKILDMKEECLKNAEKFLPEKIIEVLTSKLD